eukprot:4260689-Karenia_brevis.AAC.1
MQKEIEETRGVAEKAGYTASAAMEAVRALQRNSDNAQTIETGQRTAKGDGKGQIKAEQRSRSITFKGFPKDTKSSLITDFMKNHLDEVIGDIEAIFTYDNFEDDAGVARFSTETKMWTYLETYKHKLRTTFNDHDIYINPKRTLTGGSNDVKEMSVGKLIRV